MLVGGLDLERAADEEGAEYELYQLDILNSLGMFDWTNKSRQIGFSWTCSAEAVAEAMAVPRIPFVFVSINQGEAKEKIRYARAVHEAFPRRWQRKLVSDSQTHLEFDNGSRLMSHPCRPVRGKPKARIYLDEFAHYRDDRQIYTAAVPATTKGGRLRIGSTPLGAKGLFWEIGTEGLKRYPGYVRRTVPWWETNGLCVNIGAAREMAPAMATEHRVEMFGTDRLKAIFANMLAEDFQQEYECAFVDEASAYITWDEIKECQDQAGVLTLWHANGKDEALDAIAALARAVSDGKIPGDLAAGMDVGRRRDLTEVHVLSRMEGHLATRLMISLDKTKYEDQAEVLIALLEQVPWLRRLLVDATGIGDQIAEQLVGRFGSRVEAVTFTNANKELWATRGRWVFQNKGVTIPADRDLAYQIHSIKKHVTPSKNVVFDSDRNEKHHADKWWALALAIWAMVGETVTSVIEFW